MRQATLDKALLSQMLSGLWCEDNKSKTQLRQKEHHEAEKLMPVKEKAPSFSLYRQILSNENFSCQGKEGEQGGGELPLRQIAKTEWVCVNESLPPHMEEGETLTAYMRRTDTALFLDGIMKSGVTDEREIVERSIKAYLEMARVGKHYNDLDVKRQREKKIDALRGALTI